MPPVREKRPNLVELSENLCNALNLQDRPSLFDGIKRACHQLVDQHFDLCLPSYTQQGNMQLFVERVIGAFPGYFANSHTNEQERIGSLEAYTARYLDRNQVPRSTTNKIVKKSRDRHFIPRGQTAKVMQPRLRTLPRSRKKSTEVEGDANDRPALDELRIRVNIDNDHDDIPVDVVNSGFFEAAPEPSPEPQAAPPSDPLVEFLEDCCPSMVRCAQAFRRAGVNGKDELVGMSRWSEARLRNLLKKEDIARTALEEEALVIGFSIFSMLDANLMLTEIHINFISNKLWRQYLFPFQLTQVACILLSKLPDLPDLLQAQDGTNVRAEVKE
ncbi:hypothetical protein C8R47DRAFT_1313976 [Mycena vitilis]|nr:hypothetical protein C8R47DRAFT_1313976 [Mycena vitilis]